MFRTVSAQGPVTEGADRRPSQVATEPGPFGPNSTEVAAFVEAVSRLTPAQWRRAVAARRAAAQVTRDSSGLSAEAIRELLRGAPDAGAPTDPMSAVAAALADVLKERTDDEVVAVWQAVSALARRRQLSALTFAAHYVAFASLVPAAPTEEPPSSVQVFVRALKWLGPAQWRELARPWTLDREASASLLQAAMRSRARESEEAAAVGALLVVGKHLSGDAAWAAVKTAVHGARVLTCRGELAQEQLGALWAPLEAAIALRSLDDRPASEKPARAVAAKSLKAPAPPEPPAPRKRPASKRGPLYGVNNAEVAAFVKAVPALGSIQWLRVLDRRQLVASISRERSSEPAGVVRSTLAAITGTREQDPDLRCRALGAVERAGYALESKDHLTREQALSHYGAVAEVVPFDGVDARSFAERLGALNPEDWTRLLESSPSVDPGLFSPLVNAGDALADHLGQRSDDEAAVTWQALTALVRRHLLSPIKFAVSYAPFASAIPVTKPKAITAAVQRYLTAAGRLSANQCSILAEPWLVADDVSNALSNAVADGGARAAEEAVALVALVTVPMRLTGDAGWRAAKTVGFGARVIASRGKFSSSELEALWKPLERAIPIASLEIPTKTR